METSSKKRKGGGQDDPIPTRIDGKCAYFVERKRRYCHMEPAKDSDMCHYHQSTDPKKGSERQHQACEHCGDKIQVSRYATHLKKCNVVKRNDHSGQAFYSEGANAGSDTEFDASSGHLQPLAEMSIDAVSDLRSRISKAYQAAVPSIQELILEDEDIAQASDRVVCLGRSEKQGGESTEGTKKGRKHVSQQVSIASHLRRKGLLNEELCYVEFGAGKGGLSHTLACATGDAATHILIDRGNPRLKEP